MSLQSAYDDMLEDTACPSCGCVGMLPNGGFDYVCPSCGYEGTLSDEDE